MAQKPAGMGRRHLLVRAVGAAGAGGAAALGLPGSAGAAPADDATEAATRTTGSQSIVTPADQQYPDLVRALNARYVAKPESVRVVDHPSQVAGVVAEAVKNNKRLTVRSGGHCLEDFVYNPTTQIVLDLSQMNAISYDAKLNAIAIEAGANLLDVYEKLYATWGVTIPGGICYSVGIGGHVCGGGWGMLVRREGLVVDHLHAVEVVTVAADGSVKTVVATREANDPHRELWWAHTGGGGGSFGVVTRYFFRSPGATGTDPRKLLPKPPGEVLMSAVSWAWADLTKEEFIRLVQNYASWHAANSKPDDPERYLASFLLLNHRSNGQIGLVTQVDAGAPNAQKMLDLYLAHMNSGITTPQAALTNRMGDLSPMPQFAAPRRLPWLQATRYAGTTNPLLNDPTLRAEYKSAYMRANFPVAQAAALYKHLTRTDIDNPKINIQLTPYGGRTAAVGESDTAAPHRSAIFKMLWSVLWDDAADDAKYIAWTRQSYAETYADTGGVPVPNNVTDGCYINYPDADLNDPAYNKSSVPWSTLYFKGGYPRLQKVKAAYDPKNFFRHRQSVELPGS
ncbi:FAD-binding protein [Streptomyces sp. LP05-1]|uniref:FAD-binding protein n=1 Tax=Streptomyces pyxinae TaxID=2970734 RepID=A0ABT2CM86_9ACTN|nr:FAD-binding protein [Streptomyces sp. LP05-1]MCS0637816.1 FAD-binding protein [Streptomyces sp. LP05-1]